MIEANTFFSSVLANKVETVKKDYVNIHYRVGTDIAFTFKKSEPDYVKASVQTKLIQIRLCHLISTFFANQTFFFKFGTLSFIYALLTAVFPDKTRYRFCYKI